VTRRRETALRLTVAAALLALGYGTISGSSPTWPDSRVYAAVAFSHCRAMDRFVYRSEHVGA
jgi:hypothetical protein